MFKKFIFTSQLKWVFLGALLTTAVGINSEPAFAGCNVFGCSQSSVAECNPFGCPNSPMGQACTPFGCPASPQPPQQPSAQPPSPQNNSSPNNGSSNNSSSSNSKRREICNSSGEKVKFALGYEADVSRGWWTLDNGQCLTIGSHPVYGMPTHYYASTARTANRDRWMGDRSGQFCVGDTRFEMNSASGCFNDAELRPFGSLGTGRLNLTL